MVTSTSIGALYHLGNDGRARLLEAVAAEISKEIQDALFNWVPMGDGLTKAATLKNARRRMKRVRYAANVFGRYISQPFEHDEDGELLFKPRVRMPAVSERVAA